MQRRFLFSMLLSLALPGAAISATSPPQPVDGSVELQNYRFSGGETMPTLKLHYLTLGTPQKDAAGAITNAVMLLHGTSGSAADFLKPRFFQSLYGAGEPLDISRYFIVIPDGIGAGESSKPSDGLHAHFPKYGYTDQVRTQHATLEQIGIKHLKLVLGTSMGGMQTWLYAETYPEGADAFVPIASTPAEISGRNEVWREMISQAIRDDPDWKGGDYPKDHPPQDWIRAAMPLFSIMTSNAEVMQKEAATRAEAVKLVDRLEAQAKSRDANDFLYQFESSSDYDPVSRLGVIVKPMLTINFADDLLNPPELLHLPTASNYTKVMLPVSAPTYGHQTLAHPEVWAPALQSFLQKIPNWSSSAAISP